MRYNFFSSSKDQQGFTLIEVLVALFILTTALTGIVVVITSNSSDAELIKNSYIASGLVQEGVEVVRNIRDSDWHAGNEFGTSLPEGDYTVEWNSRSLTPLAGKQSLKLDTGNHTYNYSSGIPTIFQRTVSITTVSPDEKKVEVTVAWSIRGVPRTIQAEDHLFNWH